jgi:hypothetical protein
VHAIDHRVTKAPPAVRLETERPLLLPLPPVAFDTAYREPRRVHPSIPLINWRGVRYSVPTAALGQTVEVRQPVDDRTCSPSAGPARRSPPTTRRRRAATTCGTPTITPKRSTPR